MSLRRWGLRAIVLGGLAALMVVAFGASSAWAEASTHCVKATKVSKVISGKTKHVFTGGFNDKGCTSANLTHEGKFEKLASFSESEEAQLKALLKYVNVQSSGVGGKPTVQFSGANVQVVNGEGKTATANGEGNLVVGYDENPGSQPGFVTVNQTGSHNLILGEHQEFTSYGGLLAGWFNKLTAPFASATGGSGNTASALFSSVSGGTKGGASGEGASVSGGTENKAEARASAVSGGDSNKATAEVASVSGGGSNTASNLEASVSGGFFNTASGKNAWVGGGNQNEAKGSYSSILGGQTNKTEGGQFTTVSGGELNKATGEWASVAGGSTNVASAVAASVGGGLLNKAETLASWIGGGEANSVFTKAAVGEEGRFASIFGGKANKTAKDYEAIP